jgi:hypothetical protein
MSKSAKWTLVVAAVGLLGLAGWWTGPRAGSSVATAGSPAAPRKPGSPATPAGAEAAGLGQFPERAYPAIATEPLVRVSLGLLAKNGADLTKPMPSRHRVLAASPEVVRALTDWARTAGFEPTPPVSYHEHGGVEHFQLDLVRTAVPDPRAIEAEGRQVFAAVGQLPGAHYQSWMGDIVR